MKKAIPFFLTFATIVSFAFVTSNTGKSKQINVVIDAGHGGSDLGVTSSSANEKEIVAQITDKIKFLNKDENITIHLTRTGDQFLSLTDRSALINKIKPDLVLSLHVNQNLNVAKSGMEFYVAKESITKERSNEIAVELRNKFIRNRAIKLSEIKNAPFHILKKSEVPAILVELGYMSNLEDRKYLTNDVEQNRIATTILEFISELK